VIDPFRPRIQAGGFDNVEALEADRIRHLAAVRRMFETCDVLVFTFGLTEHWAAEADGAVFPLAPGVASPEPPEGPYRFGNFSVAEVVRDFETFLDRFRPVNRKAHILLTVSPVSLVATHEDRHVLVSTVASKSILRAAVEEVCRAHPGIGYFPSYEIVTGPQAGGRFFGPDLRQVTPAGVAHVQAIFRRHYCAAETGDAREADAAPSAAAPSAPPAPSGPPAATAGFPSAPGHDAHADRYAAIAAVICDEEAIVHAPAGGA
jgi:hypothetical protein